jgi:hypothetical protein
MASNSLDVQGVDAAGSTLSYTLLGMFQQAVDIQVD